MEQGENTFISFSGSSSVSNLTTSDAVIGEDLLKWQNLQIGNINFSSTPPELSIGEIGLQDLYVKILVNDDGTINLTTLSKTEPDTEEGKLPEQDPRRG